MADIFLSYASADRERIRPVVEALQGQGWTVWWDRSVLPGQNWDDLIARELESARCIVAVWTRTSVLSEWVRIEANIGRERGILAPVLLDDVPIPLTFRQIQTACLTAWAGAETFPEFVALSAGIRAIVERRSAPSAAPVAVEEQRALDAAIARELPVEEAATLIAMIRRSDSDGLKAILEADDEFGLSGEDVVSKPFEIAFVTDAAGRPQPAEIVLRIVSPGFNPAEQKKKILLRPQRDSAVCSFLMTPLQAGRLVVQLELYQKEACVASRILRASAVPSGRPITVHAHQVVTMPLFVNVGHTQAAPQARPAWTSTWMKAGVAAALLLICVPAVLFQLVDTKPSEPQKAELPSVASPEAVEARPPARPAARPPAAPDDRVAALRAGRSRLTRIQSRAKVDRERFGGSRRPELAAANARLDSHLKDAESAYQAGDAERMKRSLDAAEEALKIIENPIGK